jgi:Contact-dependent growth inhibition CdiA C-terminal domain
MRDVTRRKSERGLSTVELTMALPLVLFAMLMLIGMGHALISKQHAVVGGQVATHHQRVREAAPSTEAVGQAVSAGSETFRLSGGGEETLSYTASAKPQKGVIAERNPLNAESQYHTPRVTNACVPNCKPFDSFARLLSPEIISGIIFSGGGGIAGDDLLSTVSEKGNKTRRQLPPGVNVTSPVEAAIAGGGATPGGGGGTGGTNGGDTGNGGNGNGSTGNGGNGNTGNNGNAGGSRRRGNVDESERKFTREEKKLADYLKDQGHDVKALREDHSLPGRKADSEMDGKRTEFKYVDPGASSGTIRNSVNASVKGGGQARDIIIDARGSGLSEAEARRGLARAGGITRGRVDSVRIVGDGFDITSTDFR